MPETVPELRVPAETKEAPVEALTVPKSNASPVERVANLRESVQLFTRNDSSEFLARAAAIEPATFNPDTNSVQVVFSTGADVQRSDFDGPYIERLSLEPSAVDLRELRGGPVLDNHDRFSGVGSILGVVEDATVDGKRGVATLRLSSRTEVAGLVQDIRAGIIRNISAGYTVQKWAIEKRPDQIRIKTAVKWTPKEISFVPIGADPAARTRNIGAKMNEELQQQIRGIATAVNVSNDFAEGLISRGATIEEARGAIIAEAARSIPPIQTRTPNASSDGLITRLADGLRARINPAHRPDAGREFATSSIADLARHYLVSRNLPAFGSRAEIIQRAMQTTSDFPNILAEVFGKELLQLRGDITPLAQLFRKSTMADFRAKHILDVSDGAQLEKVNETGEIKFGALTDKELASYRLDSYARGYNVSFQTLVNDDLGALADLSAKLVRGANQWFANFLFGVLKANAYGGPKMPDSQNLFHATHGNLAASSGAPSETTLAAGKLAMRSQKDINGDPMNVVPKFIVVPAALESTVEKLLAEIYPQGPDDLVVSARNLTPVVETRLDFDGKTALWYLFADPAIAPVLEYAELSGYEGPRVDVQQGFHTLGTELRVVYHLGAGAISTLGAWKNVGA